MKPALHHGLALFTLCATSSVATAQNLEEWVAPSGDTTLSTSFQTLKAKSGRTVTLVNGIYVFKNVTIPSGSRVKCAGPNPMIWVVTGDFLVDGELAADGSDGQHVMTLNSANVPIAGGTGGPAGGRGGAGSPATNQTSPQGEDGHGPYDFPAFGGRGGSLAIGPTVSHYGSGGGGGVFGSAGDLSPFGLTIAQTSGAGGDGRSTLGPVPGGAAGNRLFVDRDDENDFWGVGFDVARNRLVVGELPILVGGSGGGGGGDRTSPNPNFFDDEEGGGGGGGGGCLIIYAEGKIVVRGTIHANGGNGGGGEDAGGCRFGGGGGGGSGGMLVLAAHQGITVHVLGETYDKADFDYALSADGGVGRNTAWQAAPYESKYVRTTPRPNAGGFGGLGLLQLIAPMGTNSDGTNTRLDDGITLVRNNQVLTGSEKQRFLAWKGWKNAQGIRVDDAGKPIPASNGGDFRPQPILLPLR
ncbi:MAG: hypothetical protein KDC95_17515 [Planctomycetes bacterium]|nr:hypothetical protein [Planctomycetota bacterium]